MCTSAAVSASLKSKPLLVTRKSQTLCGELLYSTLSPLSAVYAFSSFLARVRPTLGSRARQDPPGTQQGAGGLPTTDVHQQ